MTQRRSLNLKLVLSVLAAFLLSMAFTWFLHSRLSERDAYKLIDSTFESVEDEITDCVDERLVRQCMAVRERLDEGYPTDLRSLQALAREMGVTLCDCYSDWKRLSETEDVTMLLVNRINHPTSEMHELFARRLFDVIMENAPAPAPRDSSMFRG